MGSIRMRVGALLASMLLTLLLTHHVGYRSLEEIELHNVGERARQAALVVAASELEINLVEAALDLELFVSTGRADLKARFHADSTEFRANLERCRQLETDPQAIAVLADLGARFETFFLAARTMVDAPASLASTVPPSPREVEAAALGLQAAQMNQLLDQAIQPRFEQEWLEARTEAADRIRGTRRAMQWVIVAEILVLGLMGAILVRGIVRPLRRLQAGVERVAAGDLGVRVGIEGGSEIARLGEGFDAMVKRRAEVERQLQESEAQSRSIVASSRDGVAFVRDGLVALANQAAADILGYPGPAELVGLPASSLVPEPGGWPVRAGTAEPAVGTRQDGTRVELEVSTSRIGDGEPAAWVAVIRDVSSRRALERMKDDFIANVSHELRTPLTSIRGALRLLQAGHAGDLAGESARLVAMAATGSERLHSLVGAILDLEKLESGRQVLERTPVDPAALVEASLAGMRGLAEEREVTLTSEVSGPAVVHGDPIRLGQVLDNLVSNAVKHSRPGSAVLVRTAPGAGGTLRVEVVDSGPGIPPERIPLLFSRFQQLDSSDSRRQGGTGLGLAIARAVVDLHGGRIGAESLPGSGSTFWFEIPSLPEEGP